MKKIFDSANYWWIWYFEKGACNKIKWLFKQFLYDLNCCKKRVQSGYCAYDTADIVDWFLGIFPSMCEEYEKNRNYIAVPEWFGGKDFPLDGELKKRSEKLSKNIESMCILFRESRENCEYGPNKFAEPQKNIEYRKQNYSEAMDLLKESLWMMR